MTPIGWINWTSRVLAVAGLGCITYACDANKQLPPQVVTDPAAPRTGSCDTGSSRECTTTLGEQAGVLTCYKGTQTCNEGQWSTCGYGTVHAAPAPSGYARDRSTLALGSATTCSDNPCDPGCQTFEEIPTAPVTATVLSTGGSGIYNWQTGSFAGLPSGLVKKGLQEPCSDGSDCQFNMYCYAPDSGTCEHNKCQTGTPLEAGCDPCVDEIIAGNPLCEDVTPAGGGPAAACSHSTCVAGAALVDGCSPCASAICDDIPSCCSGTWDASCIAAVVTSCGKSCGCNTGELEYNGSCYYQEEQDYDWDDARDECQDRGDGWDLASIGDVAEDDFINDNVIDGSETWHGMFESSTDVWEWSNGDPSGTWEESGGGGGGGGGGGSTTVYDWGAVWKYRSHNNFPGATWNTVGFNDNSWSSGAAELGFGDGDEATSFNKRKLSYYFRYEFNLTEVPGTAALDVLFDDGYVAYVNGTEVARAYVTNTAHSATSDGSGGDDAVDSTSISVAPFVVGTNVVAIMVKNSSQGSSDVSFNSRLITAPATVGINWGETWNYEASNSDPGGTWADVGFNDSGWSSGDAQLGFGDGDEATSFSRTGASYYFRKNFTLADTVAEADLSVLYDDGYVAYVNGTEVARDNVSNTSHSSYASSTSDENETDSNAVLPGLFVVGSNTLAVMVKNRSAGSSDVSFDAALDLVLGTPPPTPIYEDFESGRPDGSGSCAVFDSGNSGEWEDKDCSEGNDSVCEGPPTIEVGADPAPTEGPWTPITLGDTWKYRDDNVDPGALWRDPGFNDSSWSTGTAHFGYGDGDESTVVSSSPRSYYFRKTLTINNEVSDAYMDLVFDDGAEVYVNGVEVMGRNIGSVSHNSLATATSDDDEVLSRTIDTSAFVIGTNVISVLVKNVSDSSSDISFDAQLDLNLCPIGGCPPDSEWSQTCVDEVATTCDAVCDSNTPPSTQGACTPHYPGETDPTCAGIDLAVGIPCDGVVPVCNHGQSTAPSGLRLIHFPGNSMQYPLTGPDQSHPQMKECFTDAEIPPGQCVEVTTCSLNGNREIMVNPPGADEVTECSAKDNWSLYSNGACGPPICSGGTSTATLSLKPVDIIFVIDNSSSMDGEIYEVQERINRDFAGIIAASGIDFRVIMISRYGEVGVDVGGSDNPICIGEPLGGHDCSSPTTQAVGHNPPFYYHFSTDVESTNGLCRLLEGLSNGDEVASDSRSWTPVAPGGYDELLREDALKQFVVITDDDVDCSWGGYSFDDNNNVGDGETVADDFDRALTTISPSQFGTTADRNYVFHSIVAMSEYSTPEDPWPSTDPIQTGTCSPGSDGPGTGYQALSVLTDGLRYPTCRNDDFNAIFNALAQEVVDGAEISCSFDLTNEGNFDPDDTSISFLPPTGPNIEFTQVDDAGSCTSTGFYYEDGNTVTLCPDACSSVQASPDGELAVEVGCLPSGDTYETFEYTEEYESECDPDKIVTWGFLAYDSTVPGDASIEFRIRTAAEEADLATAPWTTLSTATAGNELCALTGPSPCPIDLFSALGEPAANYSFMELDAIMEPTSDGRETPILENWRITYSCQFDH